MKKVKNVDAYIAQFPKEVQILLEKLRTTIQQAAPEAKEIIKYGIPTFTLGENLVHFGAFKKHIGFYPTPSPIVIFARELAPYECAKGSVQFPFDKPLPVTLIRKIIKMRITEIIEREKLRKRTKRT